MDKEQALSEGTENEGRPLRFQLRKPLYLYGKIFCKKVESIE
jgi:hypothetical protein